MLKIKNHVCGVLVIILPLMMHRSMAQLTTMQPISTELQTSNSSEDTSRIAIGLKYTTWIAFAGRFIPWALWVDRYLTLIYYILGFPGNLISMIVWMSRRMYKGNSAAIYLAALSLNDIIILIFALHRDLGRNWGVFSLMTSGTCEVLNTVISAVQYASPLYVLGFTVERWLAVCRPFLIDRICNAKRAIYICLTICAGTIFICLGNAVRSGTHPTHCYKRFDGFAINFYLTLLEAIFSGIVPLMVLIFNCLVIRELARIHRTNKTMATVSSRLSGSIKLTGESNHPKRTSNMLCCRMWKSGGHAEKHSGSACVSLVNSTTNNHHQQNNTNKHSDYIKSISSRSSRSSTRADTQRNDGGPRQSSLTGYAGTEERHSPSFRSTTFMLLCVSFYMIIATLLAGSMYLLNHIFDEPDLSLTEEEALQDPLWQMTMRILTIKTFGDEIAMSYYAFGFIIYYATGHSFRERVHQLFRIALVRCGCCRESLSQYRTSEEFDFTSVSRRTQRRTTSPRQNSVLKTINNNDDNINNNVNNNNNSNHNIISNNNHTEYQCDLQRVPSNGSSNKVQSNSETNDGYDQQNSHVVNGLSATKSNIAMTLPQDSPDVRKNQNEKKTLLYLANSLNS